MKELLDTDGENRAVRAFLMLYGTGAPTAAAMALHMKHSGFDYVPEWVARSPGFLTKGGAQLWLRQLFGLENGEAVREGPGPTEEDPIVLWAEIHRLRAENAGPDGKSWKEAAVAERRARVTSDAHVRLQKVRILIEEMNKYMGAETEGEGICAKILRQTKLAMNAPTSAQSPDAEGPNAWRVQVLRTDNTWASVGQAFNTKDEADIASQYYSLGLMTRVIPLHTEESGSALIKEVPEQHGYTEVRIDTRPDEDGWCFCTPLSHPDDVASGRKDAYNEKAQFFGKVVKPVSGEKDKQ